MKLTCNGSIVDDDSAKIYRYFGFSGIFSPADIRQAVENNPDGEDLIIELNSGGGDLIAGYEMYSVLRNACCRTAVEIQSLAASAATVMMCGADTVSASPVAQVMIHLPSTSSAGNQNDFSRAAEMLESNTESIINAYISKCGDRTTRAALRALMDNESWMPVQDAQEIGLIDEILSSDNSMQAGVSRIVNSFGGLPDIGPLKNKYLQIVSNLDTAKKENAKHALELECARYGGNI